MDTGGRTTPWLDVYRYSTTLVSHPKRCEMCEAHPIRYVHTMEHPDYPDTLDVGCVCESITHISARISSENQRPALRRGLPTHQRTPHLYLYRFSGQGFTVKPTGSFVVTFPHASSIFFALVKLLAWLRSAPLRLAPLR